MEPCKHDGRPTPDSAAYGNRVVEDLLTEHRIAGRRLVVEADFLRRVVAEAFEAGRRAGGEGPRDSKASMPDLAAALKAAPDPDIRAVAELETDRRQREETELAILASIV